MKASKTKPCFARYVPPFTTIHTTYDNVFTNFARAASNTTTGICKYEILITFALENEFVRYVEPKSVAIASFDPTTRWRQSVRTNFFILAVKTMITDINRFNESDCNARQQKIQQSNIYSEFSSKMKRRLKE